MYSFTWQSTRTYLSFLLTVFLLTTPTQAISNPFNEHQVWTFECRLDALKRDGHFPKNTEIGLKIVWNRDANLARTFTPSGNAKGLIVIPGFTDRNEHMVHFFMTPATAKFTGDKTKQGRYGGWLEAFGPTLISIRTQGHVAMTRHDITHGGMQAYSHEGNCEISGTSLEVIE